MESKVKELERKLEEFRKLWQEFRYVPFDDPEADRLVECLRVLLGEEG